MEYKEEYIRLYDYRERIFKSWLGEMQAGISSMNIAQENLETTRFQKNILTNIPNDYFPQVNLASISDVKAINAYFERQYPAHPLFHSPSGGTITITSASSIDIIGAISQSSIDLSPWIGEDIRAYEVHQQKSLRIEKVYQALLSIDQFLGDEFQKSKELYYNLSLGISKMTSVGIAMRNVIEHVKGKAFSKVSKTRGKVKWKEMADTLCIYSEESVEFGTLVNLENAFNVLHDSLTIVAKNLQAENNQTIDVIWVQYLDFLFSFTSLIKIT